MKVISEVKRYITIGEFITLLSMYDKSKTLHFEYKENGEEPISMDIKDANFSHAVVITLEGP